MILLAVDLYGIRPFAQAKRIVFKPGLNVVVGENGSGKTIIYQVLSSLLFNTPPARIAFFEDQTQQAAVTFQIRDATRYRIARDYKKEMWNLSKKESTGKQFTTLETDYDKISLWLKTNTGGLNEGERALLFMIDPFRLPSRLARGQGISKLPLPENLPPETRTGFGAENKTLPPPQIPDAQRAERAEKEQALKDAQQKLDALAEIDDEMLRKRDEADEIKKRIREVEEIEKRLQGINKAETEKFSHFSSENLIKPEQMQNFEADEKKLADDFDTFETEGQGLEAALILKRQETQRKDPLRIIGLLLITASFLLPFVISLSGPLRYVFLTGVLTGTALSGFAYFKRMKRTAAQNRLEANLHHLDERVRKREQQFEKTYAAIYAMMKKTGAKDLSELKSRQNAYSTLKQKKEAARAKIETLLAGETPESLREKAEQFDKQAETLREQLKDHQSLSEEVYRLQEVLRDTAPEAAAPDSAFSGLPDLDSLSQSGETSFFPTLLNMGENGTKPSRERLEHDAGILYRRFQPQNSAPIKVAENGEIRLGQHPLHHLSPGLADQVFLSLALSSLSQFSKIAFPFFLDAPFESLDPASREAAIKILKIIAKKRQVILFTTHPECVETEQVVTLAPAA